MPRGWVSTARLRAPRIAGVLALFIGGYYGIAEAVSEEHAHVVAIPLDARIPFLPWTVFVYASVYTSAFLPAFVVRDDALFRRVCQACVFVRSSTPTTVGMASLLSIDWSTPVASFMRPWTCGLGASAWASPGAPRRNRQQPLPDVP